MTPDDRHGAVRSALDDFLDAEMALQGNPADLAAVDRLRSAFWAVIAALDEGSRITSLFTNGPPPNSKDGLKRFQIEATAKFLLGANLALTDGPISRGSGALAAYAVDALNGNKLEPLFADLKGQGNRGKSTLATGAGIYFTLIVYFKAGLEKTTLSDSFMSLAPDRSYENFSSFRRGLVETKRCQAVKNAGAIVGRGGSIPTEYADDVAKCQHFLSDEKELRALIRKAYREP